MSKFNHQQIIEKTDLIRADLSGAILIKIDLNGADLREADLREVDLREADLSGADLSKADLSGANLSKANLIEANLIEANLIVADLRDADLRKAGLSKANLRETNFNNADLRKADLGKANLIGAKLIEADLRETNFSKADLRKADLREANLVKANFSGADLKEADFRKADLTDTNLRDTNLTSAVFEDISLERADISGANIYHLNRHGWKIDGINCTHVYQCPDLESWENLEEREKYRRDFKPGEFEEIYKTFPSLDLIFEKNSDLDYQALLRIIDRINQELPTANVKLRKIEQTVDTTASIIGETEEVVKKVANMLPEQYTRLQKEFRGVENLLFSTDQRPNFQPQNPYAQLLGDIVSHTINFNAPVTIIIKPSGEVIFNQDQRQYIFSTYDEAEGVAQNVINHLRSSKDTKNSLTELDRSISPQLEDSQKKNWFTKALERIKDSHDKLPKNVLKFLEAATGGIFIEIFKSLFT